MSLIPAIATGMTTAVFILWSSDRLPSPKFSFEENMRRLSDLTLSTMSSIGVAYLITKAYEAYTAKTERFTTEERLVLPGYYE